MENWIENVDPILYGPNGDNGLIREHQDQQTRTTTQKEDSEKFSRRILGLCALFGAIGPVMKILEVLHVLPK